MGSFGALYYATKLNPAAVIVGKPLINLGTIANNMKLVRQTILERHLIFCD